MSECAGLLFASRRHRLIQLLLSCEEEKPAAVIASVYDHSHLERTGFCHALFAFAAPPLLPSRQISHV